MTQGPLDYFDPPTKSPAANLAKALAVAHGCEFLVVVFQHRLALLPKRRSERVVKSHDRRKRTAKSVYAEIDAPWATDGVFFEFPHANGFITDVFTAYMTRVCAGRLEHESRS